MRNSVRFLRDNQGFSLTEIMIGAAVSVVIAFGVYQGLQLFQSTSKKIEATSATTTEIQQAGSYFSQFAESAAIALRFQHLPIPISGCATDSPCIRQLVKNELQPVSPEGLSLLSALKSSNGKVNSIEFFKDQSGDLYTNPDNLNIRNSPPITLPTKLISSNYYATWPLYTDQSAPFVILKKKESFSGYFAMDKKTSEGSTFTDPYTVFSPNIGSTAASSTSSPPSSDMLNSLVNNLVAVYDSRNPEIYTIKVISEVPKPCYPGGADKPPIPECRITPPAPAPTPAPPYCLNCIAVRLDPVTNFDLYSPSRTPKPSTWGSQSIYAFPTNYSTIQAIDGTTSLARTLLGPPADVRMLSHYLTTLDKGKYSSDILYMIPISLTKYSLVKMDSTKSDSPYKLIAKTYSGKGSADPEVIVATSLVSQMASKDGSGTTTSTSTPSAPSPAPSGSTTPTQNIPAAVFMRKLGTLEMTVILNNSK